MKRIVRSHLRRKAIVSLKTGDSFVGVLYDADKECVILRNAEAVGVGSNGQNVGVDGEVLVLRPDIAWMQLP